MIPELTHYIGGKTVSGTSGKFADVFDPNTGGVQARAAVGIAKRRLRRRLPMPRPRSPAGPPPTRSAAPAC